MKQYTEEQLSIKNPQTTLGDKGLENTYLCCWGMCMKTTFFPSHMTLLNSYKVWNCKSEQEREGSVLSKTDSLVPAWGRELGIIISEACLCIDLVTSYEQFKKKKAHQVCVPYLFKISITIGATYGMPPTIVHACWGCHCHKTCQRFNTWWRHITPCSLWQDEVPIQLSCVLTFV